MSLLRRYTTSNLSEFFDDFFNSVSIVDSTPYRSYRRDRWVPVNDTTVRLEVELAGYTKDKIEVYSEDNMLTVSAKDKTDNSSKVYFKTWPLDKYDVVKGAKFENGLLSVQVEKVIPDEKKKNYFKIE